MTCIAIDASSQTLGLCLAKLTADGSIQNHAEFTLAAGGYSSRKIPTLIRHLSESSGIAVSEAAYVAVTKGPGSFTGLRVGMATAKGISFGLDVPVVSVGVGALLTLPFSEGRVPALGVLDIRMGRYFAALLSGGAYYEVTDVLVQELSRFVNTHLNDEPRRILLTGPDAPDVYRVLDSQAALEDPPTKRFEIVLDPLYSRGRALQLALLGFERFKQGLYEEPAAAPTYGRRPAIGPSS